MKKEFIITRQGKEFVLFEGLLDEAHNQGLKRISTSLIQIPHADNGHMAVVSAEVETEKGTFSGIGDASPENVNRMIIPHLLRMAECVPFRAKILTRDGWKHCTQVRIGAQVLSYDLESDICRWVPLEDISAYRAEEAEGMLAMHGRSFDVSCTPGHTWAVRNGPKRTLRRSTGFRAGDGIIISAPAEPGTGPLTPVDAAILGWLATDGTVRQQLIHGRWGPYIRAVIRQSKPHYVDEIRELTAAVASESKSPGRIRDFGAYESDCLPQHTFNLRTDYAQSLLGKLGWDHWKGEETWLSLCSVVTRLSAEAREAMLDAMLKGDGTLSPTGGWTFGKKRKPGVMEAFEILATLQGIALGRQQTSTVGEVPLRRLRKNRVVTASYLTQAAVPKEDVWCPTTRYGTWVMNLDGCITITGNTRAKARALRDAVNVGVTAVEELGDFDERDEKPASRRQDIPAQTTPRTTERQAETTAPADYPPDSGYQAASANQLATLEKLSRLLGKAPRYDASMTSAEAADEIRKLSVEHNERKQKVRS